MNMRIAAPQGLLASAPMIALVRAADRSRDNNPRSKAVGLRSRLFAWIAAILFLTVLAGAAVALFAGVEMLGRLMLNEVSGGLVGPHF
jgi:hypothetical protein